MYLKGMNSPRAKTRVAEIEVQFASMLVDICRTELTLGDPMRAERALADARATVEIVADKVLSRSIGGSIKVKLAKAIKRIKEAERALEDRKMTVDDAGEAHLLPLLAQHSPSASQALAAASGRP